MRIAALYDIHGNLPALNAVLEELEQVRPDVVVIGGDMVSGPGQFTTKAKNIIRGTDIWSPGWMHHLRRLDRRAAGRGGLAAGSGRLIRKITFLRRALENVIG